MADTHVDQDLPNGPVAAAFLAGGIGAAAMGLTTTLSEASPAMSAFFNWYAPVGPLFGKVGVAMIIYLVAWIVLHASFRTKQVAFGRIAAISLTLLGLGLLGTFPPFFVLFSPH